MVPKILSQLMTHKAAALCTMLHCKASLDSSIVQHWFFLNPMPSWLAVLMEISAEEPLFEPWHVVRVDYSLTPPNMQSKPAVR